MRAIMGMLHRSFNISVAEADHGSDPSRSILVADAAHPRAEHLSRAIIEV